MVSAQLFLFVCLFVLFVLLDRVLLLFFSFCRFFHANWYYLMDVWMSTVGDVTLGILNSRFPATSTLIINTDLLSLRTRIYLKNIQILNEQTVDAV